MNAAANASSPKLTVGIPTFNRAAWLRETLVSVLTQSFNDFRLIVSDNASDDDTGAVVQSFSDKRLEYVRSDHNIGALGNLNRLIALTDTEYLLLLPDDDILYQGHLEASLAILERSPTAGLVHSAFNLIDAGSNVLQTLGTVRTRAPTTVESGARALKRMMVTRGPLCFSSVVYRAKVIREAGGFVEDAGPCADLRLWMRIGADCDLAYIAKPLVGFRAHEGSISANIGSDRRTAATDGREVYRITAQMAHEQRRQFLEETKLDPQQVAQLRSLAALQLLIDDAFAGLPSLEVAYRLAALAQTSPDILRRPTTWKLIVAQLGGRSARAALHTAGQSLRQGDHASAARPGPRGSRALQFLRR